MLSPRKCVKSRDIYRAKCRRSELRTHDLLSIVVDFVQMRIERGARREPKMANGLGQSVKHRLLYQ